MECSYQSELPKYRCKNKIPQIRCIPIDDLNEKVQDTHLIIGFQHPLGLPSYQRQLNRAGKSDTRPTGDHSALQRLLRLSRSIKGQRTSCACKQNSKQTDCWTQHQPWTFRSRSWHHHRTKEIVGFPQQRLCVSTHLTLHLSIKLLLLPENAYFGLLLLLPHLRMPIK